MQIFDAREADNPEKMLANMEGAAFGDRTDRFVFTNIHASDTFITEWLEGPRAVAS